MSFVLAVLCIGGMSFVWPQVAFATAVSALEMAPLPPGEDALVVKVVDGDTIDVLISGQPKPVAVRYIGVDSPEDKKPNSPLECGATEATQANLALVAGKTVRLERDTSNVDRYGRLLRYVWLPDGRMVNEELARVGMAFAKRYKPDTRRAVQFEQAMEQAKTSKAGLWSVCIVVNLKTQPIGSAATQLATPMAASGNTSGAVPSTGSACPANAPIKGNINNKGEKIYHRPGQQAYEKTKPEACYATPAAAEADGFRAAKR